MAGVVLAMDAAWAIIGTPIEHAQLAAKQTIDTAEDEEAAGPV